MAFTTLMFTFLALRLASKAIHTWSFKIRMSRTSVKNFSLLHVNFHLCCIKSFSLFLSFSLCLSLSFSLIFSLCSLASCKIFVAETFRHCSTQKTKLVNYKPLKINCKKIFTHTRSTRNLQHTRRRRWKGEDEGGKEGGGDGGGWGNSCQNGVLKFLHTENVWQGGGRGEREESERCGKCSKLHEK